jgi:hypothetical protein
VDIVMMLGISSPRGMLVARTIDFKNFFIVRKIGSTRKGNFLRTRHIGRDSSCLFVELVVAAVVSLTSCDGESNVVSDVLGLVGRLAGAPWVQLGPETVGQAGVGLALPCSVGLACFSLPSWQRGRVGIVADSLCLLGSLRSRTNVSTDDVFGDEGGRPCMKGRYRCR